MLSNKSVLERRQFRRLDRIFPVEFQLFCENPQTFFGWYQGWTQDVGAGGICLTVNALKDADCLLLEDAKTRFALDIHIPAGAQGIRAYGRPAWLKELKQSGQTHQFSIGVTYERIDAGANRKILRYLAWTRGVRLFSAACFLAASAGFIGSAFFALRIRVENERLLSAMVLARQHQRALQNEAVALQSRIAAETAVRAESQQRIAALQETVAKVSRYDRAAIAGFRRALEVMRKRQAGLQDNLSRLAKEKNQVDKEAADSLASASLLEKQMLDKLYRWLLCHQNKRTGLVASFEGDAAVGDWAFTYDQALAAIIFSKSGDTRRAGQIFDFYTRAQRIDGGGWLNAYYASSGAAAEYTAHAGPNIWLGLAVLRYTAQTKDKKYLGLALEISRWLATLTDKEGGIKGGKPFSWYSSEHNLDAYAFYSMLSILTGQEDYKLKAGRALDWLEANAYSKLADAPVKRGKGDSTIATDTYAWSISAVGPRQLARVGMDPDGIMDFALQNCGVSVSFSRPDGPVLPVKGFDFAKSQNLARGGVVSCEWTAQMILALKIMARYHQEEGRGEQAKSYELMARDYINELSKMIIVSPSPVGQGAFCLPYASMELADTGHGWRTPAGSRTGSVAATAYCLLAVEGVNPLRLD